MINIIIFLIKINKVCEWLKINPQFPEQCMTQIKLMFIESLVIPYLLLGAESYTGR